MVKSRRYDFFRFREEADTVDIMVESMTVRDCRNRTIVTLYLLAARERTQDASDDSRYIRGQEKPQQKIWKNEWKEKEEIGNHNKRRRKKA